MGRAGGWGRWGELILSWGVTATASSAPTEKASATEARYNKLKEKHSELVNTHAELLRKVGRYTEGREGSPERGGA